MTKKDTFHVGASSAEDSTDLARTVDNVGISANDWNAQRDRLHGE